MIKKFLTTVVLLIIFLHPQAIRAEGHKYIEIFDPKQDKVVKVVQINKKINSMVVDWLNNIDGLYTKIDPIRDDGYVIRFPIDPAIQVENKWLKAIVKEVYLIIPENNQSFFMVFETENRLVCFPFTDKISTLSKILDFKLIR